MADFLPVNPLESALRKLITRQDGRVWQVLDLLPAARLWLPVHHPPEFHGSERAAAPGHNPAPVVFGGPDGPVVSFYTAEERVREALGLFDFYRRAPALYTWVSGQGDALLRWIYADVARGGEVDDLRMVLNYGAGDSYHDIGTEMIGYLLERPPLPDKPMVPDEWVDLHPAGNPEATLGPLRDWLARSPNARAAWIFGTPPAEPGASAPATYHFGLVMVDPEDQSLLGQAGLILKAVTPLEEEWTAGVLMASDDYRRLAADRAPFYAARGFLAG